MGKTVTGIKLWSDHRNRFCFWLSCLPRNSKRSAAVRCVLRKHLVAPVPQGGRPQAIRTQLHTPCGTIPRQRRVAEAMLAGAPQRVPPQRELGLAGRRQAFRSTCFRCLLRSALSWRGVPISSKQCGGRATRLQESSLACSWLTQIH